MSETRIKIKELEMNGETAIRIAECLKKHEPEIWKVLSGELKQALRIHGVSGQVCVHCGKSREMHTVASAMCLDRLNHFEQTLR